MFRFKCLIVILFIPFCIFPEIINLKIPLILEAPTTHEFYHELLVKSLEADGHTVNLITQEIPWKRIQVYLLHGDISISWMLKSEQRDNDYMPIDVNLTNGLIGKRILFITQGSQHIYNNVKTLEDFRDLEFTAGFGSGWFDVNVWKENDLLYKEQVGNWTSIYKMLSNQRVYNYFPRGFTEIVQEENEHPELDVEENLVLIYDRDFHFYLSKFGKHAGAQYKEVIEQSLKNAEKNGLLDSLVKKYWSKDFEILNYDDRVKIYLKTPK